MRGAAGPARNPMVGAVIVKDGVIVGEGYHERPARPHAEVIALRAGRRTARGATLYVTLEPCCHFGRTPPCTNAVIASGISSVVRRDARPEPESRRQGHRRATGRGISDRSRPHRKTRARKLNEVFIKHITTGLPVRYTEIRDDAGRQDRDANRRLQVDKLGRVATPRAQAESALWTRSWSGSEPSSPTTRS